MDAVEAIADVGARPILVERTRRAIRATPDAGKNTPAPVLNARGKELEH
jgi:hypothetical protein